MRCKNCGGSLIRVGIAGCLNLTHPPADLAQQIAADIEDNLNDRSGMGIDSADDDIQNEIRDVWAGLIRKRMRKWAKGGK